LAKFHHLIKRKEKRLPPLQRIFGGKNPLNWPHIEEEKKLEIAIFRLEVLANHQNIARLFS
jgi:hypothetical protein